MKPDGRGVRGALVCAGNAAEVAVAALLLGIPVGLIAWLFLYLMYALMTVVWKTLPSALGIDLSSSKSLLPFWFIFAVTVVGALALALCERVAKVRVQTIMPVLAQVKKTGRYEYRGRRTWRYFASALLPLVFGSAVGPEAGLANSLAAMCTWAGDKMKSLATCCAACAAEGRIAGFADVRRALIGLGCRPYSFVRPQKVVLYSIAIAGGVTSYGLASSIAGGGLSLPRLPEIAWTPEGLARQFAWALPCAAAGIVLGVVYCVCDKACAWLGERLDRWPVRRNLLVALALSLLGSCIPYVMFSGEGDLDAVVANWRALGVGALLGMVLGRCILTPLCIRCGWKGGQFFPLIFMGVAAGYAVALAAGVDPVLCASFSSAAMLGAVMRKPVVAAATMLLVMPLETVPFLLVAAALGSVVPLPASWGVPPAKRFGAKRGKNGTSPAD